MQREYNGHKALIPGISNLYRPYRDKLQINSKITGDTSSFQYSRSQDQLTTELTGAVKGHETCWKELKFIRLYNMLYKGDERL